MMPLVAIAAGFSFAYQYGIMRDVFDAMTAQGLSLGIILLSGMIQTLILLFFACFFGRILAEKLGLWKEIRFLQKPLTLTLIFSLAGSGILLLDCLTFGRAYPPILDTWRSGQTLLGVITGILYGGIVEELLMRLMCMSLFSFLLWKIFARKIPDVPQWALITGNIIAALLFAAGHLPATLGIFGQLNALILLRCFLLNGISGIFFGILYRKYGLHYSMLCHMGCHIFFKLLFAIFF